MGAGLQLDRIALGHAALRGLTVSMWREDVLQRELEDAEAEVVKLKREIGRLRGTLEYYADALTDMGFDDGCVAREALQ